MLKSANLLHKCGLGDSDMSSTVIGSRFLLKFLQVELYSKSCSPNIFLNKSRGYKLCLERGKLVIVSPSNDNKIERWNFI